MMRSGIHFVAQNVRAQEYRELRIFSQPVPFNGAATMLLLLRLLLVFFSLSLSFVVLTFLLVCCRYAFVSRIYSHKNVQTNDFFPPFTAAFPLTLTDLSNYTRTTPSNVLELICI